MMMLQESTREQLSDSTIRTGPAVESAVEKSLRIFEGDRLLTLKGVVEFREAKAAELKDFLTTSPDIGELLAFADRLRLEGAKFLLEATTGEVERAPRKKIDPADKLQLSNFFDKTKPCNFEGCNELRDEWDEIYAEAGGDACPGCVLGGLRRQFEKRVLELGNAKSG